MIDENYMEQNDHRPELRTKHDMDTSVLYIQTTYKYGTKRRLQLT